MARNRNDNRILGQIKADNLKAANSALSWLVSKCEEWTPDSDGTTYSDTGAFLGNLPRQMVYTLQQWARENAKDIGKIESEWTWRDEERVYHLRIGSKRDNHSTYTVFTYRPTAWDLIEEVAQ